MESFIGITGISRLEEIIKIYKAFSTSDCGNKTLRLNFGMINNLDQPDNNNSCSARDIQQLADYINCHCLRSDPVIHLNGFNRLTRKTKSIGFIQNLAPNAIVQINRFDWTLETLTELKNLFWRHRIILPFNPLKSSSIEGLKEIKSLMDDEILLIDTSEGTGTSILDVITHDLVTKLRQDLPDTHFAVAGGLSGNLSRQTKELLLSIMPVSVDAESFLKTEGAFDSAQAIYFIKQILQIWESSHFNNPALSS